MNEHYIIPQGPEELASTENRILQLPSIVLQSSEWLNVMVAAETVLPRREGKRLEAAELNLRALMSRPQMRLFAAILGAAGKRATYATNKRYRISEWTSIVERFAYLSLYVVPPAQLEYSGDLCSLALNEKYTRAAIRLVNVVSEIEPRIVRQLVSRGKIKMWSAELEAILKEKCSDGEDIDAANSSDEPHSPDDYYEWRSASEAIVELAYKFYGWTDENAPDELGRLDHFIKNVERPPDPESPDDGDRAYIRESSESSYWTLERMFEDL